MDRKLASVQKIVSIKPIEKADSIEVCEVLGWQCVVKKSENFKVGDVIVYVEVDSIMPEKPEFEFLRDRKFRVKTIKLRGQVSQGLVLPMNVLPEGFYAEGADVTELLGVKKYDPQGDLEAILAQERIDRSNNKIEKFLGKYKWYRRLFKFTLPKKDGFPSFIKKTDEDRIQLFPKICEQEKDTLFSVTEKIDGQSGTYFLIRNKKRFLWWGKKYIFGVCSRNLLLSRPDNSSYWTIARQFAIEKCLETLIDEDDNMIVLQGEIIGEGIQGNKYGVSGRDFYAFNLIRDGKKFNNWSAKTLLKIVGIKFVPILEENFNLKPTIAEMVEFAKGDSKICPGVKREGVVVRNYDKNLSFKVINPDFLLKFDE